MAESELIKLFQKTYKRPIFFGRRSLRSPVQAGVTRGPLGSYGSRPFAGRNSQAGEQKERAILASPAFQAFLRQRTPQTPTVAWLKAHGTPTD
jgi:hypothetical protein